MIYGMNLFSVWCDIGGALYGGGGVFVFEWNSACTYNKEKVVFIYMTCLCCSFISCWLNQLIKSIELLLLIYIGYLTLNQDLLTEDDWPIGPKKWVQTQWRRWS